MSGVDGGDGEFAGGERVYRSPGNGRTELGDRGERAVSADAAFIGLYFAGQYRQQGGFADAVAAYDPDLITLVDFQVVYFKETTVVHVFDDIFEFEQQKNPSFAERTGYRQTGVKKRAYSQSPLESQISMQNIQDEGLVVFYAFRNC